VRANPVGQRLCPARLGIGVARGTHDRDKDLRLSDLATAAVDQLEPLAGIVDEHALAGGMALSHRWRQPTLPGPVQLAPTAIAIATGFGGPIFFPQQHQRDAGPAKFAMDMCPIRLGFATPALRRAGAGVQHRFQHAVRQCCRQRPGKPRGRGAFEGESHRAAGDPERASNRPFGRATLVFEAQDLSHTSHRHFLGWHRLPRPSFPTTSRKAAPRPAGRATTPPLERWPTSNRNGRDQIGIGGRLRSGISGRLAPESASSSPQR